MSFIKAIIGIVVAVVMVTAVLIPTLTGTNTSTWSTGDAALFAMGTTFAVIGLIYAIAAAFGLV